MLAPYISTYHSLHRHSEKNSIGNYHTLLLHHRSQSCWQNYYAVADSIFCCPSYRGILWIAKCSVLQTISSMFWWFVWPLANVLRQERSSLHRQDKDNIRDKRHTHPHPWSPHEQHQMIPFPWQVIFLERSGGMSMHLEVECLHPQEFWTPVIGSDAWHIACVFISRQRALPGNDDDYAAQTFNQTLAVLPWNTFLYICYNTQLLYQQPLKNSFACSIGNQPTVRSPPPPCMPSMRMFAASFSTLMCFYTCTLR